MADGLRAKLTLDLDDRLTPKSRQALGGFRREVDEVTKAAGRGRDAIGRFNKGLGDAGRVADRAEDDVEGLVRALRKANGELGRSRSTRAFELGANIKHSADGLEDFSRRTAGLIRGPIEKFASFEEQMSSVTAATFDLTKAMTPSEALAMEAAVGKLSATARGLGASTKYSATEAAAGMDILAKNFSGADLQKAEDVVAAMPGILNLAAATRESIENSSDISTAAMNQFGLQAGDMGLIGDILVKTANGSATGLTDIGEALKYAGVSAKAAGVDLATTTAMIGALGNAGKKGSTAGTGLASVLGNLQSGMRKQRGALKALGIDVSDKAGNLRPVLEIFAEIDKAADQKFGKGKGGVKRDRWLQALVGMGSDKETLAILTKQAGSGELQALVAANQGALGTAAAVAAKMNANTAGSAKSLNSAYEDLQLTIGERLVPDVVSLLDWTRQTTIAITDWTRAHPDLVRNMGLVLGGLAAFGLVAAPVLKGVGAVVTVVGGLSKVASVAAPALRGLFMIAKAHPFMALATAAYLVYEYWEPITGFFEGLWGGITSAFDASLKWILGKIEWVDEKITAMREAVTGDLIVDDRKAADQRAQLATMTPDQAERLRGLGGMVGETASRVRDEARKEGGLQVAAAADAVRSLAGSGARGGGAGAAGRGEVHVRVSDDRVRIETRDAEAPFALRAARGGA